SPDESLGYLQLGLKDLESLPAELKMVASSALAGAVLARDAQNGLLAVSLWGGAANDAYTSPHKGRFDPQSVRKIYSRNTTTGDDSALILANRRCLCEAVDSGRGRNYFTLKVPGVNQFQLRDVIRGAPVADFERLLATILGVRDEN